MAAESNPIRLRRDVVAANAAALVRWYDDNVRRGPDYFRTRDVAALRADRIEFGDLAWAVLLEGRPSSAAAQSLLHFSGKDEADLTAISTRPLHTLDQVEVDAIVEKVMQLVSLPGIRASVATKTLHPKRRASVPVIDNRAILGTLANERWSLGDPQRALGGTRRSDVEAGLAAVRWSVGDPESQAGWKQLEALCEPLTRIELFDMSWWAVIQRGSADI